MAKYKRILLKLSGESLMGKQSYGIDTERLNEYARQIKEVHESGVQIGIVIGGGNIFRGLSGAGKGFDRVKGDQMGMCATVINSLALSSALGAIGVRTKVLTAIRMEPIGEFYSKWKAIEAMEEGYVCIFSAGTGSPYFTTDTGSSLRGIEIEADVMLKGTRVDGIYTADPEKDPDAVKFSEITYDEIYTRGLKVMDLTATTMCKENNLPIYVFNMDIVGNLKRVMDGEDIGTLVHNRPEVPTQDTGRQPGACRQTTGTKTVACFWRHDLGCCRIQQFTPYYIYGKTLLHSPLPARLCLPRPVHCGIHLLQQHNHHMVVSDSCRAYPCRSHRPAALRQMARPDDVGQGCNKRHLSSGCRRLGSICLAPRCQLSLRRCHNGAQSAGNHTCQTQGDTR